MKSDKETKHFACHQLDLSSKIRIKDGLFSCKPFSQEGIVIHRKEIYIEAQDKIMATSQAPIAFPNAVRTTIYCVVHNLRFKSGAFVSQINENANPLSSLHTSRLKARHKGRGLFEEKKIVQGIYLTLDSTESLFKIDVSCKVNQNPEKKLLSKYALGCIVRSSCEIILFPPENPEPACTTCSEIQILEPIPIALRNHSSTGWSVMDNLSTTTPLPLGRNPAFSVLKKLSQYVTQLFETNLPIESLTSRNLWCPRQKATSWSYSLSTFESPILRTAVNSSNSGEVLVSYSS